MNMNRNLNVSGVVRPRSGRRQIERKRSVKLTPLLTIGYGSNSRIVVCEKTDIVSYPNWEKRLKRGEVAVKIVDKRKGTVAKEVAKVEVDILKRLKHPFIVDLKFGFETFSGYFLGLEFCRGGDLFNQCVINCKFSEEKAKLITAEVLLALIALHDMNIVYRDLKPENVAIGADGHIRLIDFGIAALLEDKNSTIVTKGGTPPYVAPEVLERKPHSFECDFWALGVFLFEILAGYPPFEADNKNDVCTLLCTQEPEIPREFSPAARSLIEGLLGKDMRKRFNREQTMNHPFFADISFKDVLAGNFVPFPRVKDENVVSNFDDEFCREDPKPFFNALLRAEAQITPAANAEADAVTDGYEWADLRYAKYENKSFNLVIS